MWIHTSQRIYRNNLIHLTDTLLERKLFTNSFEICERRNPALRNDSSTLPELFGKRDRGALAQCPWLPASQCCITLFTQFYRNAQRTSQALLLLKTFPKFQQEAWWTHTVKHSQPLLPTASHPCISTRHWLKIHETTTIPNPLYCACTDIFSCLHFPNNPV